MNYIEHLFINFKYQKQNENFLNFYFELKKEIKNLTKNHQLQIKTIYVATDDFLLLTNQELIAFLSLLQEFISNSLTEYSFEIGYESINQDQLEILKQFQVNRLVWKVRTFNSNLLAIVNQKFNSNKIINLIMKSFALKYNNFSIDLENNIVSQTKEDIISDLKKALALKAPHISYQSHNHKHSYQSKKIINQFLEHYSYKNYEFFSFSIAKKYYSQQTIAYLTLKNWYGLGPNASSFFKLNDKFVTSVSSNQIPWTNKIVPLEDSEYYQLLLTQNLMLQDGIDLKKNHILIKQKFWPQIIALVNKGYLQIENNYLTVINQKWDLLNNILIDIISSN